MDYQNNRLFYTIHHNQFLPIHKNNNKKVITHLIKSIKKVKKLCQPKRNVLLNLTTIERKKKLTVELKVVKKP